MSASTTPTPTLYEYPSLSGPQVAERLGISEASLYRLLACRKAPPSYRIGRRRFWRESDVLEWLERECRCEATREGQ